MTCPGCESGTHQVGHVADCPVMSERVVPRYEPQGKRSRATSCGHCGRTDGSHAETCSNVNVVPKCPDCYEMLGHASWCRRPELDARQAQQPRTGAPQTVSEPQDTGKAAAARIRERLANEQALYAHYLVHARKMLDAEDLHGLWDSGSNSSEVSNRIDVLQWCLDLLEGREP